MEITKDFIPAIMSQIEELLKNQISNIDEAYENSGDEFDDGTKSDRLVKIGITSQVSEVGKKHEIETTISFVKSKVKEKVKVLIGPEQLQLFNKIEAMRPRKGSGVDSITFSTPGKEPVTLHAK